METISRGIRIPITTPATENSALSRIVPSRRCWEILSNARYLKARLCCGAASLVVNRRRKAATVEITVIGAFGVDGVSQTSCRELSSAAKPSTAESSVNFS